MAEKHEIDFEAVSEGVLDAIRPIIEREMKEAANQLYGAKKSINLNERNSGAG